jgi:enoyl-CoA hydratase/carnithine racemase
VNPQLGQEFVAAYTLLDLDDRVRVVVLTADHTAPAFCSGVRLSILPIASSLTSSHLQADLSSGWDGLWSKDDHEQGRHSECTFANCCPSVSLNIMRLSHSS